MNSLITAAGNKVEHCRSPDGKKVLLYEVFGDLTSNGFKQTGHMGEVGWSLTRVLSIHATRIGSHHPWGYAIARIASRPMSLMGLAPLAY